MSSLRNVASGLRSLFRKEQVDRELDEELGAYVEMAADEKMKEGMSRQDALRAVRLERGSLDATKEIVRSGSWEFVVATLWRDLLFAFRLVRKNPGSTAAVVIALALGIGLNTTVFSFVNALLLRPPTGVKTPEQLREVWIHNSRASGAQSYLPLTFPDYLYYRDHNQSFEGVLAYDGDPHLVIWNRSGEGQTVLGQLVSDNFFSLLGVNAVLGRTISAEDDQTANPQPVVVLGYAFWRRYLDSDSTIVGKTLMLNGANYSVIGVAPAGFTGLLVGFEPDFWAPTTMVEQITQDKGRLSNWHGHWLIAIGRLKTEASTSGARAEASVLEHQIEMDHPDLKRNLDATVFPATLIPAPYRVYVSAFTALLMAVFGFVLLIACANVANFLLARSTGRIREVAVRAALGAGSVLAVAQITIATILLVGAGLMAKSFWALVHVEPGFRTENILTARLSLLKSRYPDNRRIAGFERELLKRLRARPGIQSAGFTTYLPLSASDNGWAFFIEGRPPLPTGMFNFAKYRPVSAGYFETIGIEGPTPRTVIGVVDDVLHEGLDGETEPEVYVPVEQASNIESGPTIVVRTAHDAGAAAVDLRGAISAIDRAIPLDQIETMEQLVWGSVAQPRFRTVILAAFSLLALTMASIGIYGVMNYLVIQRTREFGIRLSVGATQSDVLRLVLGRAAVLIVTGTCLGLAGSALLVRMIARLLFGTPPLDPLTFAAVPILLAAVALGASYIPARRATLTDPLLALRYE